MPSFSQPNMGAYRDRAERVRSAKQARLDHIVCLDRYTACLKGKCAYHFVMAGTLIKDNFPDCEFEHRSSQGDYSKFKKSFSFQKYTYCYSCSMLRDKNHNNEGPRCHADHTFKKWGKCSFKHVIFKVAFCIWWNESLRKWMVVDLGVRELIVTLEGFIQWANTEDKQEGKYYNYLKAFLWFCGNWEKKNGRVFH